jgi:hypothetical protein
MKIQIIYMQKNHILQLQEFERMSGIHFDHMPSKDFTDPLDNEVKIPVLCFTFISKACVRAELVHPFDKTTSLLIDMPADCYLALPTIFCEMKALNLTK